MSDVYYTVGRRGEGLYKEKMSKFISFAFPVATAEEARTIVKCIQNEYHDARHVCWAYMLGPERKEWQLNDNGEPSGTAGKPILGQINSLGLTDVAVVVVRYFGGIKLGTSGLTSAYREAARMALEDGGIVSKRQMRSIRVTFPYPVIGEVMKLVKEPGVEIREQVFDNTCELTVETALDNSQILEGRLSGLDGVIAEILAE